KTISPAQLAVVGAARLLLPQDNDQGRRGDISGWPLIENLKLLLGEVRFCDFFLGEILPRFIEVVWKSFTMVVGKVIKRDQPVSGIIHPAYPPLPILLSHLQD